MAFGYYKVYTINTSQVTGTLNDIPLVLPTAADNDLRTEANGGRGKSASAYDQRPYTSTSLSTPMDFELVPGTYNASTGAREMYAKHAAAATSAVAVLGYGDATLTTDGSSTAAWNTDFRYVCHGGDGSSASGADSSTYANNGTLTTPTATSGKLGGALLFAGGTDRVTLPNLAAPAGAVPRTISFWMYPTSTAGSSAYRQGDGGGNRERFIIAFHQLASNDVYLHTNNNDHYTAGSAVAQNAWNKVDITYTGANLVANTTVFCRVNGSTVSLTQTGASNGDAATLDASYMWGNPIVGRLDEMRISSVARSGDWLVAEYNNQNAPGSFWATGSEVAVSVVGGINYYGRFVAGA